LVQHNEIFAKLIAEQRSFFSLDTRFY